MKNSENIEQLFDELNKHCNYLILRNFECFFDDILIEGHNDIDVLCASKKDRKIMVKILNAEPRIGIDNGIHYKFLYKNNEISLDIRTVGDGYYDQNWQKNMLKNKIYNPIGFYTMSQDDYFYSLIYHAIYQKEELSKEYLKRLRLMHPRMTEADQNDFEMLLLQYMNDHHYFYTYTYDKYVKLYFNKAICGEKVKYPFSINLRHKSEKLKEFIFGKLNGAKIKILRLISK